jgi:hypothetical protein
MALRCDTGPEPAAHGGYGVFSTWLSRRSTPGPFTTSTPVIGASKVNGVLAAGPLVADDLQRAVNTCQLLCDWQTC